MARTPDPALRGDLLRAIVAAVERDGLRDLSLRPLARAVGSSPRTILYHFGSKDGLVDAILAEILTEFERLFSQWSHASEGYDIQDLIRRAWSWLASPRRRPFLAIFFEAAAIGMRDARRRNAVVARMFNAWHATLQAEFHRRGVPRGRAELLGTLTLATMHGLVLDLIETGDRARVDRAFASFVAAIEG